MPYNALGYFALGNIRAWSDSAIECYKNKLRCENCTLPEDLKQKCKMKATVIELYRRYGKPKNKEEECT